MNFHVFVDMTIARLMLIVAEFNQHLHMASTKTLYLVLSLIPSVV
jgi:hypothetical protein